LTHARSDFCGCSENLVASVLGEELEIFGVTDVIGGFKEVCHSFIGDEHSIPVIFKYLLGRR
jgi:hypothetical protein